MALAPSHIIGRPGVFKGRLKGFRGDALILTPSGNVKLNTLADNAWVYSMDPETLAISIAKCRAPTRILYNKRMLRVVTNNGAIPCTEDTFFLTISDGVVAAADLQIGDVISALYLNTDTAKNKDTTLLDITDVDVGYTGNSSTKFVRAKSIVTKVAVITTPKNIWNIRVRNRDTLFINNLAIYNQTQELV